MLHSEYATIPPANAVSTTTRPEIVVVSPSSHPYTGTNLTIGGGLVGAAALIVATVVFRIRGRVRPAR